MWQYAAASRSGSRFERLSALTYLAARHHIFADSAHRHRPLAMYCLVFRRRADQPVETRSAPSYDLPDSGGIPLAPSLPTIQARSRQRISRGPTSSSRFEGSSWRDKAVKEKAIVFSSLSSVTLSKNMVLAWQSCGTPYAHRTVLTRRYLQQAHRISASECPS